MTRIRLAAILVALLVLGSVPARAAVDNMGTDFWLAFPANDITGTPALTLSITGASATSGTVAVPGISFSQAFSVTPGAATTVTLPATARQTTTNATANLGVHVTAGAEVTVAALSRATGSTDGYLGYPVDALGTDYTVLQYGNVNSAANGTQFAIAAPSDGTTVTITPSATTNGHTAGTGYDVALNQGQTYVLRDEAAGTVDLSGTTIHASKPVAVFAGHECGNVPTSGDVGCDHMIEQLPPDGAWGRHYLHVPLATRTGDRYRLMASADDTTLSYDPPLGGAPLSLNKGGITEITPSTAGEITASKPVLLMQFANSGSVDNVDSADPFQSLVAPEEQWRSSYEVTTPAVSFSNYLNLAVPSAVVGQVTVDGTAVSAGSFSQIGTSAYSASQVPIGIGAHRVSAPLAFGVSVYGWGAAMSYESYGYVGGLGLADTGRIASLGVAPKSASAAVDSSFCPAATVRDGAQAPLAGIRVDFTVTGANATRSFATTGADGQAALCFPHAATGDSTVTATIANTFSDAAAVTWTPAQTGDGTATTPPPGGSPTGQAPQPASASLKLPKSVRLAAVVCGVVKRVKCTGLPTALSFSAAGRAVLAVTAVKGRKTVALGKVTRTVKTGKLRIAFKVKKGAKARKLYRKVKSGRFKQLRVTLTFTPAGGSAARVQKTVRLK